MFGSYEFISENHAKMLRHFAELEAKEATGASQNDVSDENVQPPVFSSNTQSNANLSSYPSTSSTSTSTDDCEYQSIPIDFSFNAKPITPGPREGNKGKPFSQSQAQKLGLTPDQLHRLQFVDNGIGLINPRYMSPSKDDLNPEDPLKCPNCVKRFETQRLLKRHREIHLSEKRYLCIECGKQFTNKSSLKPHSRHHAGK